MPHWYGGFDFLGNLSSTGQYSTYSALPKLDTPVQYRNIRNKALEVPDAGEGGLQDFLKGDSDAYRPSPASQRRESLESPNPETPGP